MRRFVNGRESDLDAAAAQVTSSGDRLIVKTSAGTYSAVAVAIGEMVLVSYKGRQFRIERKAPRTSTHHHLSEGEMRAHMPGQIVDVSANEGQMVKKGDAVLVLEAMKTQQPFLAPFDGLLKKLPVRKGDQVEEGQLLALVEEG